MCVHVRVHGCVHVHVHVHAYARVHVQALSTDPADAPAVVRSLLRLLERGSAASKGCAASEGWVGGGEGGDKARDELLCGALLSQWRKSLWREKPPFERSRREMHLRWWTAAAPWGGGYVLLFVAWGGHCGAAIVATIAAHQLARHLQAPRRSLWRKGSSGAGGLHTARPVCRSESAGCCPGGLPQLAMPDG